VETFWRRPELSLSRKEHSGWEHHGTSRGRNVPVLGRGTFVGLRPDLVQDDVTKELTKSDRPDIWPTRLRVLARPEVRPWANLPMPDTRDWQPRSTRGTHHPCGLYRAGNGTRRVCEASTIWSRCSTYDLLMNNDAVLDWWPNSSQVKRYHRISLSSPLSAAQRWHRSQAVKQRSA
jgi:hypothetical protein